MDESRPIPEQLMAPWIADNQRFLADVAGRLDALDNAESLRGKLDIAVMVPCEPAPLCAVDAAVIDVPLGDMMSLLIQAVHVNDMGCSTFAEPIRVTGVAGHDLSLSRTPLRLMAECLLLAPSTVPTIADTSFWSMLMEVNQTITRHANGGAGQPGIDQAYQALVVEGLLLQMLRNPQVIAMSKSSQAVHLALGGASPHTTQYAYVSDRELLGAALQPGEYLRPMRLTQGTQGHFGVEQRGFRNDERTEILEIFEQELGLTYFKPHSWSRAFRLEGRLALLRDPQWLMPLLSAVSGHTADRTVEPWPQFLADWNTKQLSAVAKLYGPLNFPRLPYFDPARTLR